MDFGDFRDRRVRDLSCICFRASLLVGCVHDDLEDPTSSRESQESSWQVAKHSEDNPMEQKLSPPDMAVWAPRKWNRGSVPCNVMVGSTKYSTYIYRWCR